jgi:uncharacterized membrane protein
MISTQLINDFLTGVLVALGVAILAVLWVSAISAVAAVDQRRAARQMQRAATAITINAASASQTASR